MRRQLERVLSYRIVHNMTIITMGNTAGEGGSWSPDTNLQSNKLADRRQTKTGSSCVKSVQC